MFLVKVWGSGVEARKKDYVSVYRVEGFGFLGFRVEGLRFLGFLGGLVLRVEGLGFSGF